MEFSLNQIDEISVAATKLVAEEFEAFGDTDPPAVTPGMVRNVIKAIDQLGFNKTEGLQEAWDAVNAIIKPGRLPGNGTDRCAERNGMILAANVIMELINDLTTPLPDISNIGTEFRNRQAKWCRAVWLEKKMERHYGPDWWQQPYEDIDICRYIAEHFPMMVGGNVVPAYARVRDLGSVGNLKGAF